MASTTAMFTGLSGLLTNARVLDVIGNNIANVNTTAFKSNRMIFSPIFSRNISLGTAPSASTGGRNPSQIGLGASVGGTQRNFSNGAISATGVATDIAIEGDGMFVINFNGQQFYSRAGSFQRNSANDLVTISGGRVMGYGVDDQFQLNDSTLIDLNIPVGTLSLAQATRNLTLSGNLNAQGTVASSGSIHTSAAFFTDSGLTPGNELDGTEDLTNAANSLFISNGAGGSSLAIEGGAQAIVTVRGIEKGGQDLGTHTFGFMDATQAAAAGVDAFGSTINDFLAFLSSILGLNNSTSGGHSLGGSIAINASGQIIITGNEGTVQDLAIDSADLAFTYAGTPAGTPLTQPFQFGKTSPANGESARTSAVVFDSLGTPVTMNITVVLQEAVPGGGTRWMWLGESADNAGPDRVIGSGLLEFDANGRFVSTTSDTVAIDRDNGAVTPLTVSLLFNSGGNSVTAFADGPSAMAGILQDGSPLGTLASFSISEDGIITGSFSNGLTRTIGQVALAKFPNSEGLVDAGDNLFRAGPNSGAPIITAPLTSGAGRLIGGALELSNVDLSQEFINMILASTGYSASSRIITTTDELITQLLLIGR